MPAPPPLRPRAWLRVAFAMFAVGWGANQFASLLLAYRDHAGVSSGAADALFGVYALGLIPTLLVAGPLSDRFGRRALARAAVVTSVAASVVLALGVAGVGWLYLGRLLAGVASGAVFAPGTAWVKELSRPPYDVEHGPAAGARRPAVALSAGFGLGPLVAGFVSQFAPAPLVLPYAVHLVVIVAASAAVWTVPETVTVDGARPAAVARSVALPRFRGVVAPLAPWVFTAASISLTVAPALVVEHTASWRVAFAGLLAGLTLGTGVAVQPYAGRLTLRAAATLGLGAATAGCLLEALTAVTAAPLLAVIAALLLGAGYGACLVGGLRETQRIAPPHELGALTAVFYALTYLGFAAPLVLTELTRLLTIAVLLVLSGALAAATLGVVLLGLRRTSRPPVTITVEA